MLWLDIPIELNERSLRDERVVAAQTAQTVQRVAGGIEPRDAALNRREDAGDLDVLRCSDGVDGREDLRIGQQWVLGLRERRLDVVCVGR